MKILVTGGAGFIGSNIVDRLIGLDHKVVVVDNLSKGKKEYLNPKAMFYQIDINSPELKYVFEQEDISYVIHHAARIDVQSSIDYPLLDIDNNIGGTVNLLENCRKAGVEKLIYASSAAVYGEPEYLPIDEDHLIKPMSHYGISKHTCEHYLMIYKELYDLDYTILRYANVYGPRQDPKGEGGVISIFIDKMLEGEGPVIFGDGEQTRDFIYVKDIVEANIKALTNGNGKVLNISCNTQISINDLYRVVNTIMDTNINPIYKRERNGDIRNSYLDNNQARKFLGWKPQYYLYKGLEETISYYERIGRGV